MTHPFEKMFYKALKKSSPDENLVLNAALRLREKGYSNSEILTVLTRLRISLVDERDEKVLTEAIEEFEEEM